MAHHALGVHTLPRAWRPRNGRALGKLRCTHTLARGGRGRCSFTGQKHQLLSGYDSVTKQRWTKIAEPYPPKLCRHFAIHIFDTVESLALSHRNSMFDGLS